MKDKELLMFYAQISNEYSKNKNVSHTKLMSIAAQNKAYEKIKLPAKYDYSVKELKELIDTMKLYDIETEIKNRI